MMGGLDGAALDRHITGNWGADEFAGVCQRDDCPEFDDCTHDHDERVCDADRAAAEEEARADW